MDVRRVLNAVRRRWYIVAIGLLMAIGLSFVTFKAVPYSYEASGSVLLLPPGYDNQRKGGNPFLQLDALDLPTSIVAAYMQGEGPQRELDRAVPGAKYTVAVDATTRGPVLAVDVVGTTPNGTMLALETVMAAVPKALQDLQSQLRVAPSATVGSMPLATDVHATVIRKSTLRAIVAIVGVWLVFVLMLTVAVDTLMTRSAPGRRRSLVDNNDGRHRLEGDASEPPATVWEPESEVDPRDGADRAGTVPSRSGQQDIGAQGSTDRFLDSEPAHSR